MSSFSNKGKRYDIRKVNKQRMIEVRAILNDLEYIANKIVESKVKVSINNIKEEAKKYTNRVIGRMEESILLSKLKHFEGVLEKRRIEVKNEKDS